jgi:DNA-binding transcriptional ArsR family regulator
MNTNQLRIHLNLDFRTVKHHLEVLQDNELVTYTGNNYGRMYFVSSKLEENWDDFMDIWGRVSDRLKERKR